MATQGTAQIDFGAFPGASDASLAVASAGIAAGSLVEAWLLPADTTDHLADEHWLESIKVMAGAVVAGVGFTIYGVNTSQINEPMEMLKGANNITISGLLGSPQSFSQQANAGGRGTLIYGKWNVGWVWNT